jgi:hypothetical protein
MEDERIVEAAAEYSVYRFKRAIELITSFLSEAAVLVLVFGLLDTYSTNRLTWTVGEIVAATSAVLFFAALSVRAFFFVLFRWMIRHSNKAIESAQRRLL